MGSIFLVTSSAPSLNGREIFLMNFPGNAEQTSVILESGEDETPKAFKEDRWFAKDKALHLTASLILTGVSYRVYHDEFENPEVNSRVFASGLTLLLGLGKEVVDTQTPQGTASLKDLAADGVGILLGLLLFSSTF
jgi:uncharacterized protein YfiM (DUF2279 family)